jgi:parvulin-like peptidyl-prolyl isomerase
MERLRQEVLDGADFAELARQESESQTRFHGGNLGFVEPSTLRAEVGRAIAQLTPGEVSEVIETEDGFTLVYCFGVQEERHVRFEDVVETVRDTLRRRELRRRMAELEARLIAGASPRYDLEAARHEDAPRDTVVMAFADQRVTVGDLDRLLAARPARSPPREEMTEAALKGALDRFAFEILAAHEARRLGLDDAPSLREALAWKRAEMLALGELEALVRERMVPIQEAEVLAYFEASRRRFRKPADYRLDVIRIDMDEESIREQHAEAESLAAAIRAGDVEFAEAASRHSRHSSATRGGGLGWVSRTQLFPLGTELFQTITAMEPGEVRGPIRREMQLWIVRLRDRREGRPMEYAEARRRAERQLGNERVQALRQEIEAELLEELKLSFP